MREGGLGVKGHHSLHGAAQVQSLYAHQCVVANTEWRGEKGTLYHYDAMGVKVGTKWRKYMKTSVFVL